MMESIERRRICGLPVLCALLCLVLLMVVPQSAFCEEIDGVCSTLDPYEAPSTGEVRIPVFIVEFPDARYGVDRLTDQQIETLAFGSWTGQDFDADCSMTTYYKNASYGKLQLSGDVYHYMAKHPMKYYENSDNSYETLAEEVLLAFDDMVDYTDYDSNDDGCIDSFVLTIAGNDNYWYGCTDSWYYDYGFSVDGVYPDLFIINDAQPYADNAAYFLEVLEHEFGHCMGLPDYYVEDSSDPTGDADGLSGEAGVEIMDDMTGDFSQFSKLALGWLDADEVQVYEGGTATYTLGSAQTTGDCLLIPAGSRKAGTTTDDSSTGEYFIVEFDTADGNMSDVLNAGDKGVRIFHVDAATTFYGGSDTYKEFTYDSQSEYYDTSNDGRRVIRLVNDGNGYFEDGAVVDDSTPGFAWYDADGKQTVATGLTITIDIASDGSTAQVTVSDAAQAALDEAA